MVKFKKDGSILIRNLFFIVIIFVLTLSILRFQSLNLKTMNSVLSTKKFTNYVDIIKNELYFNKQYLHIEGEVYIDEKNIKLNNYKDFKDIFENNYHDENYFCLRLKSENIIEISYFNKQKLFFSEIFEI